MKDETRAEGGAMPRTPRDTEPPPGWSVVWWPGYGTIYQKAALLVDFAKRSGMHQSMYFNGRLLGADPDTDPDDVVHEYEKDSG